MEPVAAACPARAWVVGVGTLSPRWVNEWVDTLVSGPPVREWVLLLPSSPPEILTHPLNQGKKNERSPQA